MVEAQSGLSQGSDRGAVAGARNTELGAGTGSGTGGSVVQGATPAVAVTAGKLRERWQ